MKLSHEIKVGWIPYLNLWPLRYFWEQTTSFKSVHVFDHHPSKINGLLRDREVLLAPSSTINLINDPSLEMALPLGVCAKAEVLSVLVTSDRDLSQLKSEWINGLLNTSVDSRIEILKTPILPSSSSETSNMLARLLWSAAFGGGATAIRSSSYDSHVHDLNLRVVIGDDALLCQQEPEQCIDLGGLWREWTGLPFVYAVWQAKRASLAGNGSNQEFLKKFRADLDWAADHAADVMQQDPDLLVWAFEKKFSRSLVFSTELLKDYWTKIYYRIGKDELKAAQLFLGLCRGA